MLYTDPVLQIKRNCLVVGRAATGIFLILSSSCREGGEVVVPANLCYAGIFPAIYAGMNVRFCDVERDTGNVSLDSFQQACSKQTVAAIIPHMYGQPVGSMAEIAAFCRERKILLIEDCASAMGAEADYPLGQMGDYTVYSTGYSKTLEIGYGGLVCSDLPMEQLEKAENELPLLTNEDDENMSFFSKIYRTIRNHGSDTMLEREIFRILPECLKRGFIHRITDQQKEKLISHFDELRKVIHQRRKKNAWCADRLKDAGLSLYPYTAGAVPWRFSFYAEPACRKAIINHFLKQGLPISDWYPRVTPIFADHGSYPNAKWHEEHVINFPLLLEDEELEQICSAVNSVCERFLQQEREESRKG